MKKLIALALAVFMVFSLCACSGSVDTAVLDEILSTIQALQAQVDALAGGEAAAAPAEEAPAEEAPAEEPAEEEPAPEAAADVPDDAVYVRLQFSFPEASAQGALEVMDKITQASGGRIQFETYYSFAKVPAEDVIEALDSNRLDIAGFNPSEHPIEMPLNGSMMTLPLLNFPDWRACSQIYLAMLYSTDEMMAEYTDNGMYFYAGYMCPGYQIYSNKELTDTSPSVFSGLNVICDQPQMSEFIIQNGGGTDGAFPTEYLDKLARNTDDTLVQHVNCAFVFGCFDYAKSALFFGEGGFYNQPCVYGMSQDFWDNLDPELQDIFMEYASEFCYKSQTADEALYYNAAYPALDENAEIIVLGDEDIAAWQEAIAPIVDAAVEDITAKSPNAPEILAKLKDMIANYDEDTFEIGTNNFGLDANWNNF